MMWVRPTGTFEALPLPSNDGWGASWPIQAVNWQDDEEKKRQFGIALAKQPVAFNAACEAFPDNTNRALWVSHNWITDPIVIASRDLYLKGVEQDLKLLDKNELASRVLAISEEIEAEPKDRIAALKLYGELCGYISKNEINSQTNFINNAMKITLVKPNNENVEMKTINVASEKRQQVNSRELPFKIKMVK